MGYVLIAGTILGFVAGCGHAVHILRTQVSLPGPGATGMALHRAVWAVVFWTLAGSYLLVLWLTGFVLRSAASIFSRK